MKKIVKFTAFAVLSLLIIIISVYVYFLSITKSVKIKEEKLFNTSYSVSFFDVNGEKIEDSLEKFGEYVNLSDIPQNLINALISVEDKRFYKHKGVDYLRIIKALSENIKSKKASQGASTITQQLVKNTHLSPEKTIKRKITEIKLAKDLENTYSKDQILEMYLNSVYYGNNCYGIDKASKYYFGKKVKDLNLNECALLVALLKAPSKYNPYLNYDLSVKRINVVLSCMKKNHYIDETTYKENLNLGIELTNPTERNYKNFYLNKVLEELESIFGPQIPNKINVFTNYDDNLQKTLFKISKPTENCNISAVAIKNGKVISYFSDSGYEIKSCPASTIKPLLVYAPAINENIISSATKIKDEKTNFNGYIPKNYNDKYYGYVDCKTALSKSLNVPAVSILNSLSVKKANSYLNKTSVKNTVTDLTCALGNVGEGVTVKELTESYSVFNNDGYFEKASYIEKITDKNDKVIYQKKQNKTKVFEEETVGIISDMLMDCVTNGTAKKLCNMPFEVCAKTGTNGTDKGNTDALTVAYTTDVTICVWMTSKNGVMPKEINGSSYPAANLRNIFLEYYKYNHYPEPFNLDKKLTKVAISKQCYDNDNTLVLADENAFEKDVLYRYFKRDNIPKLRQNNITMPNIKDFKISNNSKEIKIFIEKIFPAEYVIYKMVDGKKVKVYDSFLNDKIFVDTDVNFKEINYFIEPYAIGKNGKNTGKIIALPKIKPKIDKGKFWNNGWLDEY